MKRRLLILTLLGLTASCTDPLHSSAAFEITNQTNRSIDSVLIQPSGGKSGYLSLEPNATKRATINLKGFGDGAYGVIYKLGNQHKSAVFGYFSNGSNLDLVHRVFIRPDTVIYQTR